MTTLHGNKGVIDKIERSTNIGNASNEDTADALSDDMYSEWFGNETMVHLSSFIIELNGYDTECLFWDVELYRNNDNVNISIVCKHYHKEWIMKHFWDQNMVTFVDRSKFDVFAFIL